MIMWENQNKVLPGSYINVKSNTPLDIIIGSRGIVALPINTTWGDPSKIIEITPETDTTLIVGATIANYLPFNEIFKGGAKKILFYKANGGNKATYTISGTMNMESEKVGTSGNGISIVAEDTDGDGTFKVTTSFKGSIVDVQDIVKWDEFQSNGYCKIKTVSTNNVDVTAMTFTLAGGTDTVADETAYNNALTAFETQYFNTIVYDGTETAIKNNFAKFIKALRDEEGKKCQAVCADFESDFEGVVNVSSGAKLEGGVEISKVQVCYWVAGITASASFSQSNTSRVYPGAIDVVPRLKRKEREAAITAGKFILDVDNNQKVTVVQDINSLTTLTVEKSKIFKKNRTIRVVDTMANDFKSIWEYNYQGKIDNDVSGRNLYRGSLVEYCNEVQRLKGIENFTAEDIQVLPGNDNDAVVTNAWIEVLDSMEKLYMTINVE